MYCHLSVAVVKLTHLSLLITRLTETVKHLVLYQLVCKILSIITFVRLTKKKQRLVNKGTCVVKTNKTTFFHDLGPVCLKYQLLKERFLFIYLNVLLSSSLTTPT